MELIEGNVCQKYISNKNKEMCSKCQTPCNGNCQQKTNRCAPPYQTGKECEIRAVNFTEEIDGSGSQKIALVLKTACGTFKRYFPQIATPSAISCASMVEAGLIANWDTSFCQELTSSYSDIFCRNGKLIVKSYDGGVESQVLFPNMGWTQNYDNTSPNYPVATDGNKIRTSDFCVTNPHCCPVYGAFHFSYEYFGYGRTTLGGSLRRDMNLNLRVKLFIDGAEQGEYTTTLNDDVDVSSQLARSVSIPYIIPGGAVKCAYMEFEILDLSDNIDASSSYLFEVRAPIISYVGGEVRCS